MSETKLNSIKNNNPFKWVALSVGSLFAVAHIGVLGHLIHDEPDRPQVPQIPTINIPKGDYASYTIEAGPEGYRINYKANDPAILDSHRSLDLDKEKKGMFGGSREKRSETRYDQYTMEGVRNIGGATTLDSEGKTAESIECIVADAGARSQGAMAGSAITTGLVAPAVMNIPYVGWLAAGWATLLGNKAGETIGSEVGSVFNDC